MEDDPFNLERFLLAQDLDSTYEHALEELKRGLKTGHWMWFVFPQIAGLGLSSTSKKFSISSLEEARAYLEHPVLGQRLTECGNALLRWNGRSAEEILGFIDAIKLRSSATLFMHVVPGDSVFRRLLEQYFDGAPDPATGDKLQLLR